MSTDTVKQLTKTERARVEAIRALVATTGPVDVRVQHTFTDDHTLGVVLTLPGRFKIAIPWCGWEVCAAALYAPHCEKAASDLRAYIEGQVKDCGTNEGELADCFSPKGW